MKIKTDSQKILQEKKELEEIRNKYLRVLADYQNLEKRTKIQIDEERKYALKNFAMKFFDILDTLEHAEKNLQNKGLSIGVNQLKNLLKTENIEEIETVGKKFDPVYMECVEVAGEGDYVAEEIRKGYLMNGKVIRPARVKVGKPGRQNENQSE